MTDMVHDEKKIGFMFNRRIGFRMKRRIGFRLKEG